MDKPSDQGRGLLSVWVLEQGCYNDRGVLGVFSTVQRAMEAYPSRKGWNRGSASSVLGAGKNVIWSNGLDWEDAMRLSEYSLDA